MNIAVEDDIPYEDFEPIIGLEIHAQLKTRTKLFSHAPNRFGDEPNTNIGVVDTGQPGSLPLLNREAVRKAIQFGCAVHADIALFSLFDRKSYFYPDSPRNFQITQFYQPLLRGGSVTADVGDETKHFALHHAHLEDDAGMLKHFSQFAGVDDNRAGVPLIEIVSEPCMRSPKEASAYAQAVRAILQYIDASDCNMEAGSLRIDCNISVRKKREQALRTKVEIKNLNSFSTMELALEAEFRRQVRAYALRPHEDPENVITQGTFRFDLERRETILMRKKERAEDYRYCPEPDLPPLVLTPEEIEELRTALPELPHARLKRYRTQYGLPQSTALLLTNEKKLADYFEEALKECTNPVSLANWITVEFAGRYKETGKSLLSAGLSAKHVGKLVACIEKGTVTGKIAKSVADAMVLAPEKDPETIIAENPDFRPLEDLAQIEALVDQVLSSFPQSIDDYKAGKARAFDFLVGQVMKLCKGKASPSAVGTLLKQKIQGRG